MCRILILLIVAVPLWAQSGGRTIIELTQSEPEKKGESAPPLVGMEAFRELLETGLYIVGPGDEFLIYVPGMELHSLLRYWPKVAFLFPRWVASKSRG